VGSDAEYSEEEIARRLEAGLKKSLQMKPKPHKPKTKASRAGSSSAKPKKRGPSV